MGHSRPLSYVELERIVDIARIPGRRQRLLVLALLPLGGAAQPDLEGVWMLDGSYGTFGYTVSDIAYTEEGQRRHDAIDILSDDPSLQCIPSGPGRIWDNPGAPIEFQQLDDRVVIRFEVFDLIRTIGLDRHGHPPEPVPSTVNLDGQSMPTMGHSIGWYESDTLVVETLAYAPGMVTTVRRIIPQSAAMRSIERYYRDGDRLALNVTYVDPIVLAKPFQADYRFRRSDFDVVVYGCTPENAGYDERWSERATE